MEKLKGMYATGLQTNLGRIRREGIRSGQYGLNGRGFLKLALVSLFWIQVSGWGSDEDSDSSVYGNSLSRNWLYNSASIAMELEGCIWGYVGGGDGDDEDNGENGCMEDESEDGTTYWYQMANCRRAQAVYTVYASESGSTSCKSSDFKESFVTRGGLSEFIGILAEYDANNPFGDNYYGENDDGGGDDNVNNNQHDGGYEDLPACEQSENGYVGLGCSDDGSFSLQYFDDAYCLQPSGQTYDKLQSLNRALQNYQSCSGIYYGGNNNGENTLPYYLLGSSETCSSLDSGFCVDNSAMKERRSHTGSKLPLSRGFGGKSWVTKLKYATGGLLLLASFVMFTGILFTNRRRRRALMQRKYRQSRSSSRKKSSRSKSKSRDRKSSRSRSRAAKGDASGVFA